MEARTLGILTTLVMVTTVLWLVILIPAQVSAPAVDVLHEKIAAMEPLGATYYVTYVNAALITVFDVAMFAGLIKFCRKEEPLWTTIAMAFLPIYGFGNLIAYLSQIFVVPLLLRHYEAPGTRAIAEVLLGLTLQDWPGSAIQALNGLSYAVLGIPSLILGWIFYQKVKGLRISGLLLIASGLLSFVALLGLATANYGLASATLASGAVFLAALVPMARFFLKAGRSA
jgi:hypothetical protein